MKTRIFAMTLAIFALCLLAPRSVQAEEPTPGVARVSLIHGEVSTMRGDSGDWVATTVNAPIVAGDKISVGARSRTEIQLDYANILRLDQRSEAKIAELTRTHIQVQVATGLVNFTVLKGTEAEVEIDTPNMAVHPLGEGSYRLQVNSPSDTEVTVRKGEAEVSTPQGSTTIEKNQVIYVRGTDNPEYQIAKAAHKDEWDEWNGDRDHEIRDAQSWRYANRYYTGAEDLDQHGHWVRVPDYDWCWTPYVDSGWVPYRDGRWVWEPYWGWTWVSYEPWGWAPYHYGRWFYYGDSWRWWPGYGNGGYGYGGYGGYYPTWAPAYVSFLGFGFGGRNWGFGFGFGFGSIGWLPLGPYDRISPWWGHHNSYNVVNITNITNVNNITNVTNVDNIHTHTFVRNPGAAYASNVQAALANPNVRRAVTTVSTEDFVRGRVPRNFQGVDATTLRQAQVVQGTLPAVPTRESLRPVDRPVPASGTAARPQTPNNERFFSKRPIPQSGTGPLPFNERAAEIQRMVQTHNPLSAANPLPQSGTTGQANANTGRPGMTPNPATSSERFAGNAQRQRAQPALGSLNRPGMGGAQPNVTNNAEAQVTRPATNAPAGRSGVMPETPAARNETPGTPRGLPAGVPGAGSPSQRFGQPGANGVPRTNPAANPAVQDEIAQRANAGASQRTETPPAPPAPAPQVQRPWQRFGTGSAQPGPAVRPGVAATQARPAPTSRPVPQSGTPQPSVPPAAPEATSAAWQRFGSARPAQAGAAPAKAPPQSGANAPARPSASTTGPQPGAKPAPSTDRPNPQPSAAGTRREPWPAAVNVPGSTPSRRAGATPQAVQPPAVPSDQGGWQRFNSQPRPAPQSGVDSNRAFSAPRSEPSSPGWNRFPSRPEGAPSGRSLGGGSPAPRSYERPPLELRKPIVTERPAAPRSYGGGGDRGWSAPSGGGRSYSAPSGGGGRSYSAPSGGGGRSYSAPAGGGHSAPAPSAPRGDGTSHSKH
jgi:hypothetical protein